MRGIRFRSEGREPTPSPGSSDSSADRADDEATHTQLIARAPVGGLAAERTASLPAGVPAHLSATDPTQIVSRPGADDEGGGPGTDQLVPAEPAGPPPLVSRLVAAEIGMYLGAGLAMLALAGSVARGWTDWDPVIRGTFVALAAVALITLGLFVRLPWDRTPTDQGRRAASSLLSAGAGVALIAVSSALAAGQRLAPAGPWLGATYVVAALAMVAVNLISRTPLSETALLVALAWGAWILVPAGQGTWAFLVVLGALWAAVGFRWARGGRTAGALGAALALVASVGLAAGPWAWPTRAGLAVTAVLCLATFVRGGANHWLALGAGASTALAASVAGVVVGPVVALLVGGLATMAVSWIALRTAGSG